MACYPLLVLLAFPLANGVAPLERGEEWRGWLALIPFASPAGVLRFGFLGELVCGGRLSCVV